MTWTSVAVVLLASQAPTVPSAKDVAALIHTQAGDLPIVVSAPHGGRKAIPGSKPRNGEGRPKGGAAFFAGRDVGTEELALAVCAEIEKLTGKKPFLVAGAFHRKYLDCNRNTDYAYDDDAAKVVYDAYHSTLKAYCATVGKRFGGGLVVDIHGQGTSASTVYRGTKNGKTTQAMQSRFGVGVHAGPDSLLGKLKALGWQVHPEGDAQEQAGFSGGFITQTYGVPPMTTDAVQLEFGADYRTSSAQRKATSKTLAKVLVEYARMYAHEPAQLAGQRLFMPSQPTTPFGLRFASCH